MEDDAETALTAGLFAAELTGDLPALRTVAEAARRRNLIAIAKEAEAVPSKALSNWSKHLTGAAMILFAMMFSLHTSTAQAAETHKHATEQLTPASSFHNALHADVIAMVIEEIFATKKAETYTNLGPTLAPIRREGTYAVTRPVIQR